MSKQLKKKKVTKQTKKDLLSEEVAVITGKLGEQLSEIVRKHTEEGIKTLMIQLRQTREQLAAVKIARSQEVSVLTTDKKTAEAKLNQANQRLATVEKERDSLIQRLKAKA